MQTRYIAHITIEAQTPLRVGCGNSDFFQDAPVQRDFNSLPMILGTSIAGVLRGLYSGDEKIFGYQNENREDDGEGSKVIVSNALLVDENDKVNETLLVDKNPFLHIFNYLPIREHTAINHKGTVKENSKFDEEVVYKGARFRFSIEVIDDKEAFNKLLEIMHNPLFRLGGKTTLGYGSFKVVDIAEHTIDSIDDLKSYSSSLNHLIDKAQKVDKKAEEGEQFTKYTLKIKPDDFFIFGSGFGDEDADMTPIYEETIDYNKPGLSDRKILVPASSIKGAISHRTAFYYNLAKKRFADTKEAFKDPEEIVYENNEAVKAIFGEKKDSKKNRGQKGKIYISDCFMDDNKSTKVFDHVSIDRFTGGAIEGALFQEKTIADNRDYTIEIVLENGIEKEYTECFEKALKDICKGQLQLGGLITKGHGIFTGKVYKNGGVI